MEANIAEAIRAKETAERRFAEKDFTTAKNYALKAKSLCPGLEGISQMLATFDVYMASEAKCNGGQVDYYSVLGLKPTSDRDAVKKQYRKLAVLLHPDKNKTVGADGAFKLVSEAWTVLSDTLKRASYDLKKQYATSSSVKNHGLDTFWTVCTSCRVQYEYLRKYVNKRLSCKNCRGTFVAVETGTAPVNGSFPYSPWTYVPNTNGYTSYEGVSYIPTTTNATVYTTHGYDYVPNVSFQWGSYSGTSGGLCSNGASSGDGFYQVNGNVASHRRKVKSGLNEKLKTAPPAPAAAAATVMASVSTNAPVNNFVRYLTKAGRPDKRRKIVVGASFRNGFEEKDPNPPLELGFADAHAKLEPEPKVSSPVVVLPPFDVRKFLIDKARCEIGLRLEEMERTESALKADSGIFSGRVSNKLHSITVPDPDFHDFDKDRSEECFAPKQIWALYDEDDGMPRLYCLIREVVSVKPFKILITYLSSKTDAEFGSMNWISYGFTKSCGHFRAWNSDTIDKVNVFSHLLRGQKAGRGGCVRIFPRCGEIWAVYRHWSTEWTRSTPDDVRHSYEMVEVLDNYSEDQGVCIAPLIKLSGFKTVYQRDERQDAIKWVPRPEMFRFSHQVPSWSLDGKASNLPDNCWDLDPAATPDELLQAKG
ncbi:unnamed protein product [Linum trigynum]|uniref:J domain-containing protein n=1 Tax=Linum trigynum TaxID=586398 RepID=A0AAV2E825_9ROSI